MKSDIKRNVKRKETWKTVKGDRKKAKENKVRGKDGNRTWSCRNATQSIMENDLLRIIQ